MSKFLQSFLDENEEIDDETAKRLRDTSAAILAGLDQMRPAVGLKMGDIPWPRMGELADRLAVETVDWTAAEGYLIGAWMMASSRTQLAEKEES